MPKLIASDLTVPDLSVGERKPVVVSLPTARCTPPVVERLKDVLAAHPGTTEVHLQLEGGGKRTLLRLDWARTGPAVAEATVVADAFCHSMVRALVGALLKVGDGSRPAGWPAEVLAARVRDPAVPVVAPHGLCLEEVGYPPAGELAARAAQTRRLRVPLAPGPP